MTVLPSYSTGTVSVADGGTTVTGAGGANWSAVNVSAGDILQIGEFQTIISDVTDATTLVIPPWGGGVQSGASYNIWKTSIVRVVGGQNALDVNKLLAALNTSGYFVFVGPDETEPDPSLGEEGQFALQPSTGKMWVKDSGAWDFTGTFRGFGTAAAWSGATTYVPFDIASLNGTSYLCILEHTNQTPPNATYWMVLAAKGDTGPAAWTAPAAWLTATAYVAGPPASVVTQSGETYVCLTSHTSGTFATDLAAGKWLKVATKGADAPVYGGTSTTSLTIGTGSKVFTTQAGLAYQDGARVRASSASDPTNWMEGIVTYIGTTLTMTSDKNNGSGTKADWNFNVVGQPGAGDLSSANNLSDLASAATARTNLGATTVGSAVFTAADAAAARTAIKAPLAGHLYNLTLSTSAASATFGVAAGQAADSTAVDLMVLGSAYTKTTSAWAVGSGNGALDTSSIATNTFYYIFLIKRPDTGVVDILISLSATSPTLPTNYTLFRRIGVLLTNGSSQWREISQFGDDFYYVTPIQDISLSGTLSTSRSLQTLTAPPSMKAYTRIYAFNAGSAASFLIQPPFETDRAVGAFMSLTAETANQGAAGHFAIVLNSSRQIALRAGQASGSIQIETLGWSDTRGKG